MNSIILAALISLASWWNLPEVQRCCSEADAVYADVWEVLPNGDVQAEVTGGGPRNHQWAPIGRKYLIPREKVLTVPGNPTGRALLFISPAWHEQVFCFAPGPMI